MHSNRLDLNYGLDTTYRDCSPENRSKPKQSRLKQESRQETNPRTVHCTYANRSKVIEMEVEAGNKPTHGLLHACKPRQNDGLKKEFVKVFDVTCKSRQKMHIEAGDANHLVFFSF